MVLSINGERREVAGPTTVAALLEALGLSSQRVAVERNLVLVPRKEHATVELKDGDVLEIVHFVGGG
jgi:thiamine biosynthesis protein ThiS